MVKQVISYPENHPLANIKTRRPYLAEEGIRVLTLLEAVAAEQLKSQLYDQATLEKSLIDYLNSTQGGEGTADNFEFLSGWARRERTPLTEATLRNLYYTTFIPGMECKTPVWFTEAATQRGWSGAKILDALIYVESQRHRGLIYQRAQKLAARSNLASVETLIGVGWQGLRCALLKYDPTQFALSTYAATRIDGSIRDMLRDENVLPKKMSSWAADITAAEETLTQRLHKVPTLREIADHLGRDETDIAKVRTMLSTDSLDMMLPSGEFSLGGSVVDGGGVNAVIEQQHLAGLMDGLDPLEYLAVDTLVLKEMTLREAAKTAGVSSTTLMNAKVTALGKLRLLVDDGLIAA